MPITPILFELLDEEENCGQSESRAIAECMKDALTDVELNEQLEHAESMLGVFLESATALLEKVRALRAVNPTE